MWVYVQATGAFLVKEVWVWPFEFDHLCGKRPFDTASKLVQCHITVSKSGCIHVPEPLIWAIHTVAHPACGPSVGMYDHDVLIKKANVPLVDKNAGTRRRV